MKRPIKPWKPMRVFRGENKSHTERRDKLKEYRELRGIFHLVFIQPGKMTLPTSWQIGSDYVTDEDAVWVSIRAMYALFLRHWPDDMKKPTRHRVLSILWANKVPKQSIKVGDRKLVFYKIGGNVKSVTLP